MIELKIPDSGRMLCEINIKRCDSPLMQAFEFKVDTGADFSTISKETLYKLGYNAEWIHKNKKLSEKPTSVASGEEVESYYICLPVVNIYGLEGKNYPFGILMDKEKILPKPTCDNCEHTKARKLDYRLLLGNDILSCFDVSINWKSGKFILEPYSSLDDRNKKYPDRHLNFVELSNRA